jgi:hypothetical protein
MADQRPFLFETLAHVTTLILGSQLKQGHKKMQAKNATQELHSHSHDCK